MNTATDILMYLFAVALFFGIALVPFLMIMFASKTAYKSVRRAVTPSRK